LKLPQNLTLDLLDIPNSLTLPMDSNVHGLGIATVTGQSNRHSGHHRKRRPVASS